MADGSPNYGLQREYEPSYRAPSLTPLERSLDAGQERTWSVLAHLSTFVNAFTGFLGPVVAFAIWLAHRDRSPVVASHALRSVVYQVIWLSAIAAGWAVTGLLMVVLVGFLLVPVMVLVSLGPFVHASYAAYRAYRDEGYPRRRYL